MTPEDLKKTINEYIPLTDHMGVEAVRSDLELIHIRAPFEVNRNKMGSAFGGSVNALLTIAAWSWVFAFLKKHSVKCQLVIQSNETHFMRPVLGPIEAYCFGPKAEAAEHFLKTLERHKKARLEVSSEVRFEDEVCARFTGRFAARL